MTQMTSDEFASRLKSKWTGEDKEDSTVYVKVSIGDLSDLFTKMSYVIGYLQAASEGLSTAGEAEAGNWSERLEAEVDSLDAYLVDMMSKLTG